MSSYFYFSAATALTLILLSIAHCNGERKSFSDEELLSARKYVQSLENRKDSWVDPYDMLVVEKNPHPPNKIPEPNVINSIRFQSTNSKESKQKRNNIDLAKQMDNNVASRGSISEEVHKTSLNTVNPEKQEVNVESVCSGESLMIFDSLTDKSTSRDLVFLSRWLRKILTKLEEQSHPDSEWQKIVQFHMSHHHYQRLSSILEQKTPNMVDVETIFYDLLKNVTLEDETVTWSSFSDQDIFIIVELAVTITSVIFLAVLIGIMFYKRPILSIIFIVVTASVVFQCLQMYSVALAKRAAQLEQIDFHSACKQSNFGLFSSMHFYIKSYFISSGSCHDYYKAIMVNPLTEINPLKAITLTFSKFLFAPLEAFAQTCNIVVKELLSGLSYPAIGFLSFFLFVILAMVFNYRLRLPFFTALEPCAPVRVSFGQQSPDAVSKRRISALVTEEVKQLLSNESRQNRIDESENNTETSLCYKFQRALCLSDEQNSSEVVNCLAEESAIVETEESANVVLPQISAKDQSPSKEDLDQIESKNEKQSPTIDDSVAKNTTNSSEDSTVNLSCGTVSADGNVDECVRNLEKPCT